MNNKKKTSNVNKKKIKSNKLKQKRLKSLSNKYQLNNKKKRREFNLSKK